MGRSLDPSVTLMVDMPLHLPKVSVDPNQLETALLNLAINARDAMPAGGTITLSARPEQHKGRSMVCLSVIDDGTGMDAQTLARAAEPFFTTKGIGKGTGLGLSMVHGVVEQSGGTLSISSTPGKGTTVNLRLPIAEEADDPAPAEPSAEPAPEAPPPPAPGRTILVVDDDPLVLLGTQAMLEDIGHTVIAAGSAQAALDILRARGDVELVITDHAMPRMTGLQLCEAIREEWPGMPVILATGYAELPSGADTGLPRLSKPFFQNELARAVAAALPD